jgi:hypothetical protein
VLETAKSYESESDIDVLIWLPFWEYSKQFIEFSLKRYVEEGILDAEMITSGLKEIVERYSRLIEVMASSVEYEGDLTMITTTEEKVGELIEIKKGMDLGFIDKVYGSWNPTDVTRRSYELLIMEHIYPCLEGKKTLHIESSYELWPNLHAVRALLNNPGISKGAFSFILHPSTPSNDLSYMRDFNAPLDNKLCLAETEHVLKKRMGSVGGKYLKLVTPQLIDVKNLDMNDTGSLRRAFEREVLWINERLV